jgi:hypothetical protein
LCPTAHRSAPEIDETSAESRAAVATICGTARQGRRRSPVERAPSTQRRCSAGDTTVAVGPPHIAEKPADEADLRRMPAVCCRAGGIMVYSANHADRRGPMERRGTVRVVEHGRRVQAR